MVAASFRVRSGERIRLDKVDPADTSAVHDSKTVALRACDELTRKLEHLQELFFADHRYAMLVVLEGMDAAGKDGYRPPTRRTMTSSGGSTRTLPGRARS